MPELAQGSPGRSRTPRRLPPHFRTEQEHPERQPRSSSNLPPTRLRRCHREERESDSELLEMSAGASTSGGVGSMPVVLDSGASASVIPLDWIPAKSRPLRTICTSFQTDSGQRFACNVHALGVHKALISVSQLTRNGHRVAFDSSGGTVSLRNGQKHTFAEKSGVYSLSLRNVGFEEPTDCQWNPFVRQATGP